MQNQQQQNQQPINPVELANTAFIQIMDGVNLLRNLVQNLSRELAIQQQTKVVQGKFNEPEPRIKHG